jgi:hypothetical protein
VGADAKFHFRRIVGCMHEGCGAAVGAGRLAVRVLVVVVVLVVHVAVALAELDLVRPSLRELWEPTLPAGLSLVSRVWRL